MALLQASLMAAVRLGAARPSDFRRVIVDTTVQEKNITHPTDAKLMDTARRRLARLAKTHGVHLRQSYARVGKRALIKHQRYRHARQFKRAKREKRRLSTYLGRVIRDIRRKIAGNAALEDIFRAELWKASAGAHAEAPGRDTEKDLFTARAGGGVHRKRQGAQASGVRGEGIGGHPVAALERRAVRGPCQGAAGQAL